MKQTIYYALLILALATSSCGKWAQVAYTGTSSKEVKDKDNFFIFENDTIQIVYNFWAEKGVMSYLVYNKLSVPIYVDWRKSSFIVNGEKSDYWTDEETTKVSIYGVSNAYGYSGSFWSTIFAQTSTQISTTKTKKERITFIPPHSYINIRTYRIVNASHFNIESPEKRNLSITGDSSQSFPTYFASAERSNSKIVFRNFITYSTKESFDSESYLDNEFYVRKVVAVKESNFQGYNQEKQSYESPWVSPQRFYFVGISKSEAFTE